MKVLMPYVDVAGASIDSPVISGGTELFSRIVNNNFDVEVVPVPWTTTHAENKQIVAHITSVAFDKNCDVILSNNFKSVCFNALAKIGKPILHISHTNYGLLKASEVIQKFLSHGHSIYGVSQFNINHIRSFSKRITGHDIEYSGIIAPSYCMYDLPVNETPDKIITTVGRANTYKVPFIIHSMFKDTGYTPNVITSLGVDEDSIEYYNRNKEKPHKLNLDHHQVMRELSNSTVSVITCFKETFGISALESLSVGTPIIIRTNKSGEHASAEIAADSSFYSLFRPGVDVIKSIHELSKVDRKAIKQSTQEKYSKDAWVKNLSNAFDQTVEKYKKFGNKTSSLEGFM